LGMHQQVLDTRDCLLIGSTLAPSNNFLQQYPAFLPELAKRRELSLAKLNEQDVEEFPIVLDDLEGEEEE
jgi:hypothetical protein